MKVVPPAQLKRLEESTPGELVRLRWMTTTRWALSTNITKDSRLVVVTLPDNEDKYPRWGWSQPEMNVLCYGVNFEMRLGIDSPVDFFRSRLTEIPGCLLLAGSQWLLRAGPDRYIGHESLWIDLSDGSHAPETALGQIAAFDSWELHMPLRQADPASVLVARFSAADTN